MIIYKDILSKLKDAGYNTNRLRLEGILSESVIDALRNNKPITTTTLGKLCGLLDCQPREIVEYVKSD